MRAFLGAIEKRQAILDKTSRIAFTREIESSSIPLVSDAPHSLKQTLQAASWHQEASPQNPLAAVAAILRPGKADLELLLIQRSQRRGDPWSGHLAFPGGRLEKGDPTPRAAAMRETLEEIGLTLQDSEFIGALKPLTGLSLPISVAAYTFLINHTPSLTLNYEVQSAFWVPFSALKDPTRCTSYSHRHNGKVEQHDALRLLPPSQPLLWGITYRFTQQLLNLTNHPLDTPPQRNSIHEIKDKPGP